MKIGILGVGNIGATVARRLSAAGHDVKVANSRGPQTIPADVLATGARAVHAADVAGDVDALVLSIPLARIPDVAPLLTGLPDHAVVLDTSNYYPLRDEHIAAIDDGQVESLWVSEQLGGRPVAKAWNAIGTHSFAVKDSPASAPGRIAIPVAADGADHRALAMQLVDQTGFDGHDAGTLAESWRQQPGTPAYCTDLTTTELPAALAAADKSRSPRRRDLLLTVIFELADDPNSGDDADRLVLLNRLLSS